MPWFSWKVVCKTRTFLTLVASLLVEVELSPVLLAQTEHLVIANHLPVFFLFREFKKLMFEFTYYVYFYCFTGAVVPQSLLNLRIRRLLRLPTSVDRKYEIWRIWAARGKVDSNVAILMPEPVHNILWLPAKLRLGSTSWKKVILIFAFFLKIPLGEIIFPL